jgi:hypothetical protein
MIADMSINYSKANSGRRKFVLDNNVSRHVLLVVFLLLGFGGCDIHEKPPSITTNATKPASEPAPQAPQAQKEAAKTTPALNKTNPTYEDRKAWREILKWPDECEQAFDYPDKSYGGMEFYPLADKQYLVEVTCTGGAYQGYQVYYFYDESTQQPAAKPLTFESRESQDGKTLTKTETTELWGQATFDGSTKQLKVFNKFRGVGDCGILATYGFVNGEPQLKELRAKVVCDGKGGGNPEKWNKIALR